MLTELLVYRVRPGSEEQAISTLLRHREFMIQQHGCLRCYIKRSATPPAGWDGGLILFYTEFESRAAYEQWIAAAKRHYGGSAYPELAEIATEPPLVGIFE